MITSNLLVAMCEEPRDLLFVAFVIKHSGRRCLESSFAENEVAESNGLSHGVRRARVGCTSDPHDVSESLRPKTFPRRRGGKRKEILPR